MDSQFKPGFDGTQGVANRVYNFRSSSLSSQFTGYVLRAMAIVLTFIAAIVMGTAKQTTTITVTDPSTLQTLNFTGTAKSSYSSALVYFIVVNVLVFLYSATLLVISYLNRGSSRSLELAFTIADLLVVILLFSTNGAAITTSIVLEDGDLRLGWIKICDPYSKFCAQVTAAIVLSMLASIAHVVLVLLEIIGLRNEE